MDRRGFFKTSLDLIISTLYVGSKKMDDSTLLNSSYTIQETTSKRKHHITTLDNLFYKVKEVIDNAEANIAHEEGGVIKLIDKVVVIYNNLSERLGKKALGAYKQDMATQEAIKEGNKVLVNDIYSKIEEYKEKISFTLDKPTTEKITLNEYLNCHEKGKDFGFKIIKFIKEEIVMYKSDIAILALIKAGLLPLFIKKKIEVSIEDDLRGYLAKKDEKITSILNFYIPLHYKALI